VHAMWWTAICALQQALYLIEASPLHTDASILPTMISCHTRLEAIGSLPVVLGQRFNHIRETFGSLPNSRVMLVHS